MSTATLHRPEPVTHHQASWLGVVVIVAAVAAVAVVGGGITGTSVTTWYREVAKPAWTPPAWVFGPVWAALYAMMAVAASVVWLSRDRDEIDCPLCAFAIQLGLNLLWSACF